MTTTSETIQERRPATHAAPAAEAAPPHPFLGGNPGALGIPVFVAGSIVLGLNLVGYIPVAAVGGPLPIIAAGTGIGLLIATVWAFTLGQSVVASIFGVFGAFWLSYALLVFGLIHNWFGVKAADVAHTQATFLIAWLAVIGTLTVSTLRLPLAFTGILFFVDLALAAVLIGVLNASTGWLHLGGVFAFVFAAIGAYVYYGIGSTSTGGPAVPLGQPLIRS